MSRTLPLQHPASSSIGGFAPLAQLARSARKAWQAWAERRAQARQDEQLWRIALSDARVMADLSRAMGAAADAKR
jgi:hypothetical protein